jgi:hypothetical protein
VIRGSVAVNTRRRGQSAFRERGFGAEPDLAAHSDSQVFTCRSACSWFADLAVHFRRNAHSAPKGGEPVPAKPFRY